jgi:two-component system, cell cycle sensor histidine kinase and response regulator CckA
MALDPFRAVILDLTVRGGMGGRECAGEILSIDPGALVLVSSGYSNDPIMSEYRSYGFRGVITKPYDIAELGHALHLLLSA